MKKSTILVYLFIFVGPFSASLVGMSPAQNTIIKNLIFQNTAPQKAQIKKSFIEQGGMAQDEKIAFESFNELTEKAHAEKKPFTLAIAEINDNKFQFYEAKNLADHFLLQKTGKTPTRAPINIIFIYTYNPHATDRDFPFDYQKEIKHDYFKEEFITVYSSVDPTESLRKDIAHLQSLPHQAPEILHEINIKRIELIDQLNPTNARDFGQHSKEIFTILGQIFHDAQQQVETNYALQNMIDMLMGGWGQPNNRPNYPEAIRLCNQLITSNLQFNPDPTDATLVSLKYLGIDFGRFYLAELARTGLGQPEGKANLKEAIRLYKLIIQQNQRDAIYFKSKLALANIYDKNGQTVLKARDFYKEIINETAQRLGNNPESQKIISEAQENLRKNILKAPQSTSTRTDSDID